MNGLLAVCFQVWFTQRKMSLLKVTIVLETCAFLLAICLVVLHQGERIHIKLKPSMSGLHHANNFETLKPLNQPQRPTNKVHLHGFNEAENTKILTETVRLTMFRAAE
jgi:hypothetical protein